MKNLLNGAKTAFQHRRDAWGWFDHLIRAGQRYKADHGDRLAASLTMYLILALLPLMLLATSVLGYVLANDPDKQAEIFAKITDVIPGIGVQLSEALGTVKDKRGTLGLVGLGGLLFSGLGGIDALRDALRLMWHHNVDAGNFFKKKATDVVTVFVLAGALAVSFVVSALATGGAGALLDRVGVEGSWAKGILSVLSFLLGVGVDAVLFLVLFKWLPRVDWPLRRLVRGAVFGGVLFGVLKIAGAWYVGRTATKSSALYGSIGTAVAVLVGLYLVSRAILFTAAWTVTAAGWDDVEPSGTASPEAAREADIPVEAARQPGKAHDPHRLDPLSGSGSDRRDGEDRRKEPVGAAPAVPKSDPVEARQTRREAGLAGRAATGFVMTLVAVLGLYGLRSLRRG
ncbi:MAG TPA: YihY/virulence factor BrkB family protein [Frankiaceae bacterium]|nr:YihY/virulence factor BrkB family protein [Frankiaceae bacterium]